MPVEQISQRTDGLGRAGNFLRRFADFAHDGRIRGKRFLCRFQRSLQILASRRDRLNQEREALPVPDHAEFEFKQEMLAELREKIALAQEDLMSRQRALPGLDQQRRQGFRVFGNR